jgi:hypothetical protein
MKPLALRETDAIIDCLPPRRGGDARASLRRTILFLLVAVAIAAGLNLLFGG